MNYNIYPNLELMEYKAELYLRRNEDIMEKLKDHYKDYKCFAKNPPIKLSAMMFSQIWGSTCTAFDVGPNGEANIGGSAMTEAYTVVFHEYISDTYIVFVDNKMCYAVDNPNETFLTDLKNCQLKSLSQAKKYY